MNLVNVLNSELREGALQRWKVAREVTKRVDGVIYGSMAAMMVGGLPRLPRDADIAVDWSLDEFLGHFKRFEQENWFEVELVRQPPSVWEHGCPKYTLLLWEEGYRFFVNLASGRVEPNKRIGGAKLRFDKAEYAQQKKRKILEGNPTILDLLDLLWFEEEEKVDNASALARRLGGGGIQLRVSSYPSQILTRYWQLSNRKLCFDLNNKSNL